ncbi:MAG: conserved hypothetical exported protein [Chthonomonadales bacterium]|nr:conserved hypothetical exported protein [Chthonomonadales bacterium]
MQNRKHYYIVPVALLCVAIKSSQTLAQNSPSAPKKPIAGNTTNGLTVILPGAQAAGHFPKGTQFWTPTANNIAQLETGLQALAKKTPVPNIRPGQPAQNIAATYCRQYFGIIQGGKKKIYVNAFRASMEAGFPHWRQQLVMVDDGGSSFYHVTYDVESLRFGEVSFNGYA